MALDQSNFQLLILLLGALCFVGIVVGVAAFLWFHGETRYAKGDEWTDDDNES